MTMTNRNNANIVDHSQQCILALKKHVDAKTVIAIDGEPHKLVDLLAIYQACLDTRAAVRAQHASYKSTLEERDKAEAKRRATDKGLRAWVVNTFGATSTEALEFGFAPKSSAPTVATKMQAVLQSKATREARGTKGKKAKQNIKGVVAAPTAPEAPATQTQPAQASGASPPKPA